MFIRVNCLSYEYMKYPNTVTGLADEIIRVTNDYYNRRIKDDELASIIRWYADKLPNKLFFGEDYNKSLKKIIGKKRVELLDLLLSDIQ